MPGDTYAPAKDREREKRERRKARESEDSPPRQSSQRDRRHEHDRHDHHHHDERSDSKSSGSGRRIPKGHEEDPYYQVKFDVVMEQVNKLKNEKTKVYEKRLKDLVEKHDVVNRGQAIVKDKAVRMEIRNVMSSLASQGFGIALQAATSRGKFTHNLKNQDLRYVGQNAADEGIRNVFRAARDGDRNRRHGGGSRSDDEGDRSD